MLSSTVRRHVYASQTRCLMTTRHFTTRGPLALTSNAQTLRAAAVHHRDAETQASDIASVQHIALTQSSGEGEVARELTPNLISQLPPTLQRFTLGGKVAVVTGAGRGLGFNMAQALTEAGVSGLAILDVNQELGEAAAQELAQQSNIDVRFYRLDVRDEGAIQGAVQDVVDHFGRIDILISSAGIADSNIRAETYPLDLFRGLLDINLTGTFLTAQACAQHMIAHGTKGSMVFIGSMSGLIVNYPQEQCAYNASKAAVIHLAKSLATEWAKHGIRVNCISPGYMDTELNRREGLEEQKKFWTGRTPMERLGAVDELNGVAVWLASEASTFVTGANCVCDGGYSLW